MFFHFLCFSFYSRVGQRGGGLNSSAARSEHEVSEIIDGISEHEVSSYFVHVWCHQYLWLEPHGPCLKELLPVAFHTDDWRMAFAH